MSKNRCRARSLTVLLLVHSGNAPYGLNGGGTKFISSPYWGEDKGEGEVFEMAGYEYDVEIEVKRIEGTGICPLNHKVGDTFKVSGAERVEGLCGWAYNAIFPFLTVLRFGGEFPWEKNKETALVCCPDPNNSVVFELHRKLK